MTKELEIGKLLSMTILGSLYEATGSYQLSFLVGGGSLMAAFLVITMIKCCKSSAKYTRDSNITVTAQNPTT